MPGQIVINGGRTQNKLLKHSSSVLGTDIGLADSMVADNGVSIGIGTVAPAANTILELASTTQALMLPRMTTTQRDAIGSPTRGLLIYNITTNKLNFYASAAWEEVTSA